MTMRFKISQLSLLVSTLFVAGGVPAFAAETSDVGKITVQGQPGGGDTGLIQQEETPKARSSVNRTAMDKQIATANPYQQLSLLPGVNTFDYDGTGLFGGGIRVRGFNSDQLGFTIDGAPVNDSGSFAVYPQEYTDPENLCEVFVTQGSTDTEAPHVGASGGNIGMSTCDPIDTRRTRISSTFGSNALWKGYIRFDSGKFLNDRAKFFISYSKAQADKWRGAGRADKEHVDFKGAFDLGGGSYLKGGFLYNWAVNNNYRSLTKAQINQYGWNYDFGTVVPVHQPGVNGTAQNDTTYAPNAGINNGPKDLYYGYNLNPFKNYLATALGHFQFNPSTSVDVDPYFWYGFGTGGNQLQTLTESVSNGSVLGKGIADINGDGDNRDTVFVYEGSRTRTYRPGVTTKVNFQFDNHRVMLGYWYERARHQQTGPYVTIDNAGNANDIWLEDSTKWLKNNDGSYIQYRDTMTISTGKSAFVQDSISLLNDKLNLQLGVRDSGIDRDFYNYPSQTAGGYYELHQSYSKVLPSLGARFQLAQEQSVFFNAAKNFKTPGNFSFFGLIPAVGTPGGGTYNNGVLSNFTIRSAPVMAETSTNYDLGYRLASDKLTLSGSLFYVDYHDRIAKAYDPNQGVSIDFNVGPASDKGFELEAGYNLVKGLTAYGSLSYIKSEMKQDIYLTRDKAGNSYYLPVSGKEFPDTPNWLAGASLQYAQDNWYVFTQAKYTGKRFTTLVNDDQVGGYTTFNAGAGVTFNSTGFFKKPTIRFNVTNLFDKRYLNLNGGSGSQFTGNAQAVPGIPTTIAAPSAPSFYTSAPRAFSVNLSTEF
jgi:iron complex outermembrane receptor protein